MSKGSRIAGFVLTIPDASSVWMYAGKTPEDALAALRTELMASEQTPDAFGSIVIEMRWFTQEELDTMPEFPGW